MADMHLKINERDWRPYEGDGEEIGYWGPSIYINGVMHHCLAIRVNKTDDWIEPVHPDLREEFDALQTIWEGRYETVAINGHQHVIAIFPACE